MHGCLFQKSGTGRPLSTPAVSNRVQKLQEQGVIKGYTAVLDAQAINRQIICYCQIFYRANKNHPLRYSWT